MNLQEMKEKITSYATLVEDGHETYNDVMNDLLTMLSFLTDEDDIEEAYDHLNDKFQYLSHEMTIEEHLEENRKMAIDQAHEYTDQNWTSVDAYAQNVYESMIEDGYCEDVAFEAKNAFYSYFN